MSRVFDLDGRRFRPISNMAGGRVASDALFKFSQSGLDYTAVYSGEGFSDGHLIGRMTEPGQAALIYHSRANDGALEAGEAVAVFSKAANGGVRIDMEWRWLTGSKASGTSHYQEIIHD